jgi:hypothetical protein
MTKRKPKKVIALPTIEIMSDYLDTFSNYVLEELKITSGYLNDPFKKWADDIEKRLKALEKKPASKKGKQ